MADPLEAAVELPELRTRDAKHYVRPNGVKVAEIGRLRHYFRTGLWRDVDLTLAAAGGGVFRADKSDIVFEADSGGFSVFEFGTGRGIRFLFPVPPDRVENWAAYWTKDTIEWEFRPRRSGVKTEATVSALRGPKTYSFDAQMLGGLSPPNPDAEGNLVHARFVVPRSVVVGADGSVWPCSAWRRQGGTVEFDFDDSPLPVAALPYVIDPTTTFNVAAGSNDGHVSKLETGVYPPGGTATANTGDVFVRVRKRLFASSYDIYVGLVRWDTSSIPDLDEVLDATLRVRGTLSSNADSRDITAEWYEAGTIDAADYTDVVGTSAHAGTSISSLSTSADQDFVLTDARNNVSRTGFTGLRLHVTGGQPTGQNYYEFASFNDVTLTEPRLIVTYWTPPESYSHPAGFRARKVPG